MSQDSDETRALYENIIQGLKEKIEKFENLEAGLFLLAEEADPAKLVDLVAETAARLIKADTVAVPMLSPDNLEIHYGHAYGRNREKFLSIRLPIENAGLCGWVLENRKRILCANFTDDPRVSKDLAKELGYTTAALAPLVARGKIIGGLSAFRSGPAFTEEDISELTRLANYAALAIDNARLMLELSKERKNLNTIYDGVEDGIILLSYKGEVLKANKSVEKYQPVKSDDLIGSSAQEYANLQPLDEVFSWDLKALPGQRCWEIMDCTAEMCPMHRKDYLRCWALSDGYCHDGSFMGHDGRKLWSLCSKCDVVAAAAGALAKPREISIMGKSLVVTSSIIKHDIPDELFGEILVLHDITSKKKMEEQRSDFFSMLSHDLKAPLTNIIGYCGMIEQEDEPANIKEMNRAQRKSANHLLRLIKNFLDLSRIEVGKVVLEPEPVALDEFLPGVCHFFSNQAAEKRAEITWRCKEPGLYVVADVTLLYRIMENLLSNALNFISEGGEVHVEAGRASDRFIEISVSDDGPGVPKEDQARIFEKYYSGGTKKTLRSSGLGLAIVKVLAEAHGGNVKVGDREGGGTVFTVTLPIGASTPSSQAHA